MATPDLELLRLENILRLARDRLAGIIRMVPDPVVLRAAEDLCAEASDSGRRLLGEGILRPEPTRRL
jgi:hypothetical protein